MMTQLHPPGRPGARPRAGPGSTAMSTFLDSMPGYIDEYEVAADRQSASSRSARGRRRASRPRTRWPGRERPDAARLGRRPRHAQEQPVLRLRDVRLRRASTGDGGDCYDRYMVRVAEMRESVKICRQALERLPGGAVQTERPQGHAAAARRAGQERWKRSSTTSSCGPRASSPPPARRTCGVESPRGELGFYIVSDGSGKPIRVHERAPSFANLQALPLMAEGGAGRRRRSRASPALDPIMGEVDR